MRGKAALYKGAELNMVNGFVVEMVISDIFPS